MKFSADKRGFLKKVRGLKSLMDFFENISIDAAAFHQEGVVTNVINGQYVGVISGNLKRSIGAERTGKFSAAVTSDLGIAPYSTDVRKKTEKRYGKDFYDISFDMLNEKVEKDMDKEFRRALSAANEGRLYSYRNPFPASAGI